MTSQEAPQRTPVALATFRSIAFVRPEPSVGWDAFAAYQAQLEAHGVITQLTSLSQLLDIETGALDVDAIASIGRPLDSARCAAVARRVPYIVLENRLDQPFEQALERGSVAAPVLLVTVSKNQMRVALRSVSIDAPAEAGRTTETYGLDNVGCVPLCARIAPSSVVLLDHHVLLRSLDIEDTITITRLDDALIEFRGDSSLP